VPRDDWVSMVEGTLVYNLLLVNFLRASRERHAGLLFVALIDCI